MNGTYQQAYPALVPLASGADDRPAGAIAQGAVLNEAFLDDAHRQFAMRKALLEIGDATVDEVRLASRRKDNLKSSHNFCGIMQYGMNGITRVVSS